MIKGFRKRIGVKLFVFLAVFIFLAITPFVYVVFSTLSSFGKYTVDVNRDEMISQAHSYLSTIAREQAHGFDAFFSHVEAASSLIAAQAGGVYDTLHQYQGSPDIWSVPTAGNLGRTYQRLSDQQVHTVFLKDGQNEEERLPELVALSQLNPMLKGVQIEIPESVATHMVTVSGICRYLGQSGEGAFFEIKNEQAVAKRCRQSQEILEQFQNTTDETTRKPLWTQSSADNSPGSLLMTVSSPVLDADKNVRGMVSIDIPIAATMATLEVNNHYSGDWISDTLFSFILDDKGRIVAFPDEYLELFGLPLNDGPDSRSSKRTDVYLSDSGSENIRRVVSKMLTSVADIVEVQLNDTPYILSMHALHLLNWHLVQVSREAQLTPSIKRTEEALSGTLMLLVDKFIVNAIIIILVLLVVIFLGLRYFVVPLRKLSEAALLVGKGDLTTRCQLNREDELGILADSFNDMVRQLEAAEKRQKSQAKQLELTVLERTRELRNKNFTLHDVISQLNAESERRKRAVDELQKSEERIRIVMDASLAGHAIIQDQKFKYVNSMASRIFGYSREEMASGVLSVEDLVVARQYGQIQKEMLARLSGEAGRPYVIECRRKDGSVFDALVGGAMTTWDGKPAIVVTIMDISDQKQTEEELLKSKLLLQNSLKEKEVLLREIYHRTKNNMLVIISMLHLQALEIDDERIKNLFWEMENRIKAMSLVHEKLYQSQNLVEIDLGEYLEEMVTALVRSMIVGDAVTVRMQCEQVAVSVDTAVPLGLAVNEIVTNSLKHGFPEGHDGSIYVNLSQEQDNTVEVVVGDDGVGFPVGTEIHTMRSFGMQITANLIEKQLQGTMTVQGERGVVHVIRFKENLRAKRL